ncbi:MAG TPA: phosphotransferase family protein [Candidatus Cybelea sp.]|nr:phosphotransferase family protein [Candidatus Cybelea sp.]
MTLTAKSQPLADFITRAAQAESVRVDVMARLGGGAIQENWAIDLAIEGGPMAGTHRCVLRSDAVSGIAESWPREKEFALIGAAHDAGVAVPEPLFLEPEGRVIGRPFYIMRRASGTAHARRVLRDLEPEAGDALAHRLGLELSKLHRIRPENAPASLAFLPKAGADLIAQRAAHYRRALDALPEPQPVLEWAINRMEDLAPPIAEIALAHRDFRTGNYMVDGDQLTAILDFEFTGWSDPYEDLGWFCARCWRFGATDREAGGIGTREAFYAGYAEGTGHAVDEPRVRYWEAVAPIRWGLIALQQGERHASGAEPSLDLALTALRAIECDYDLLFDLPKLGPGKA